MKNATTEHNGQSRLDRLGFQYVFRAGNQENSLLLLHGTGGDEYDLLDLGAHLAPRASLMSPRGRSPEGPVNRWFARFAPGVLDTQDVIRRAEELRAFVKDSSGHHQLDPARIWAVGYSNGANMAAAILLLHPELFAGALLLRPMLPLRPEAIPNLSGRPVYIAAGSRDTMIPRESTEDLIALLRESGARVTENWTDAGHGLSRAELDSARDWYTATADADRSGTDSP